jgi:hypothetical protein
MLVKKEGGQELVIIGNINGCLQRRGFPGTNNQTKRERKMYRIKFNINQNVLVKLTLYGRNMYFDNYKKLTGNYPNLKEDEHGYTLWQLWELMSYFGPYMGIGGENCFNTYIFLEFNKEPLKEKG